MKTVLLLAVLMVPCYAKKPERVWKTGKVLNSVTLQSEVIAGATTRTTATGTGAATGTATTIESGGTSQTTATATGT